MSKKKISKKVSDFLSSPIVLAIAYIAIGILLCVKQAEVITWAMIIAGALFIAQGVIDWFMNKQMKEGVVEIVVGVLLIVLRFVLPNVLAIVLGVALIIRSVVAILTLPKNIMATVYNVLGIIIGALLIIGNYVQNWIFLIIGIAFIINGVLTLFGKQN